MRNILIHASHAHSPVLLASLVCLSVLVCHDPMPACFSSTTQTSLCCPNFK